MVERWVLIHGWGMSTECWQPFATYLPKDDSIEYLELPGHGDSAVSINWEATLQYFLEKISENSTVVGWSLGGLLAIEFAKRYPQRVKKLILITTNPCWLADLNWPGMCPTVWCDYIKLVVVNFPKAYRQFLLLQTNFKRPTVMMRHHPEKLVKTLHWLVQYDLRSSLRQLTMPVLHILGKFDKLVPYQLQNSLMVLVPEQRVIVLQNASHNPMQTHPEHLAQLLIDWSRQ